MLPLKLVKQKIKGDPEHWSVHLMDFVDDFRYYRDRRMIEEPFPLDDERLDALLAATAEQLCYELKIKPPEWILAVPAPRDPWFEWRASRRLLSWKAHCRSAFGKSSCWKIFFPEFEIIMG
jgi:hypothetical protein